MKTENKQVNKRIWYIPITKWTVLIGVIISGMIWCPLSMQFALKRPIRAAYLTSKIFIGYARAYNDAQGLIVRTGRKIVPKQVRRAYKRYGLDSGHRMAEEVSGKTLYTPPKSIGDKLVEGGGIFKFFGV